MLLDDPCCPFTNDTKVIPAILQVHDSAFAVTTTAAVVVSGSPRTGKCRAACDSRSVSVRTTGPVQACVSDTALPHVIQRDVAGRQQAYQCQQVSTRWRGDATCPSSVLRTSSPYTPTTCELCLIVFCFHLPVFSLFND